MLRAKLTIGLFSLFFSLFLLLLAYKIVLFATSLNFAQQQTLDYLQGKASLTLPYTSNEASHLLDVKRIILLTDIFFYILIIPLLGLLTAAHSQKIPLQKLFRYASGTTILSLTIILLFTLFLFDIFFRWFHLLFFPQGNWLFPADSLLIQTFPLNFFTLFAVKTFFLTLLFGIIFILLTYFPKHDHRTSRP